MGGSSQLPSQPDGNFGECGEIVVMYLFLPDTLEELEHRQGRVWGAIVRPACELRVLIFMVG